MRIILIGASGLVGASIADHLLAQGRDVHALVRHATGRHHPRWHEHLGEIAAWPDIAATLSADAAISALGTTWRKAGSKRAFRAVDHDGVVAFAAAAAASGVPHFLTISAVGANPSSRNFYLRTKGEAERDLAMLGFRRLDILQPGLLIGDRGADRRLKERAAILVSPLTNLLLRGRLDRFAAIPAAAVARAAAACLSQEGQYLARHENGAIRQLAGG